MGRQVLVLVTHAKIILAARCAVVVQQVLGGVALNRVVSDVAIIRFVGQVDAFENQGQVLVELVGDLCIDVHRFVLAPEIG